MLQASNHHPSGAGKAVTVRIPSSVLNYPEGRLIFRKYYGADEDEKIIKIINTFFKAIKSVFAIPEEGETARNDDERSYWSLSATYNILHTTIGCQALFGLMVNLVRLTLVEDDKFDIDYYKRNWLL